MQWKIIDMCLAMQRNNSGSPGRFSVESGECRTQFSEVLFHARDTILHEFGLLLAARGTKRTPAFQKDFVFSFRVTFCVE